MTEMDVAKMMFGWANSPSTTMLAATTSEGSNVRYGTVIAVNEDETYDIDLGTDEVITTESDTPLSVGDRVGLVNQDGSFILYGMATFVGESRESDAQLARDIEDKGKEIKDAAAADLEVVEKAFNDFKATHKLTDDQITKTITDTNAGTVETFEGKIEDLSEVYTTKSEFTKGLNDFSSSMSETYQNKTDAGTMEQNLSSLISQNTKAIQTEVSERTTAVSGAVSEAKSYTDQTANGLKTTVQETIMDEVKGTYATKSEVSQTAEGITVRLTTAEGNIETAQDTADAANTAAGNAQTTANNAGTAAANAKTAADNAASAANAAQGAANTARAEASNAAKTATNYLSFTSDGLVVGDHTGSSLGSNVIIDSDSVDIRKGTTVLATFASKLVELGKDAADAVINLCKGAGVIKAYSGDASKGMSIIGGSTNKPMVNLTDEGISMSAVNIAEHPAGQYARLHLNTDGTIETDGTAFVSSDEGDLGSDTSRWKRLFTKAAYFANSNDTASAYKFGIAQWNDKLEVSTRDAGDNGVKSVAFTVNGNDGVTNFNVRPTFGGKGLATLEEATGGEVDLSGYMPKSGGTFTGNVTAPWFQTTSVTDLGKASTKIAVIRDDGWLYYRTPAEILSDIGAAASGHTHSDYAKTADIATTKYNSTSSGSATYFKIADFGSWGTGAWYQKGFSMLIGSRAGELVWVSVAANDSATDARAIRLMNRYSKIAAIHYSASESAIYVTANAWVNNVTAHILSNIGGDYVPSVSVVSGRASDCVEINIVEFGINSTSAVVGDSSVLLEMGGSATRPTYNGSNMALQSDIPSLSGYATESWVNTQIANAGGGSVSIPSRLASYQDHTVALADPNSAVETGFYYINTATNRPPFSQSSNVDYRVLTTAYSDQWLQQIATDFRCPDMFVRRRENGTWTSWVKIMSEEGGRFTKPISFQDSSLPSKTLQFVCGIDAFANGGQMGWQDKGAFLAGYATEAQLGNYLPLSGGTITNRLYANEWIQFNNECGLYFPNHNGLHIMPNNVTSFTPLRIVGDKGGYNGAIFGNDKTGLHVMSSEPHQGLYNESTSKWIIHYNRGTGTVSLGTNDAGSATVNVGGSFYVSGAATFAARPTVNGAGVAMQSEIPSLSGYVKNNDQQTITADSDTPLYVKSSGSNAAYVGFTGNAGSNGYLGVNNGTPVFYDSQNRTLLHSGNYTNYLVNSSAAVISPFNASGTNGNVTLTSSAANYSILEIFYTDGTRTMSQRVYSPNGKTTILQRSVFSSTSAFYDGSAIVTISGTSITWSNQGRLVIGTGSAQTVEADTTTLKIVCVLGWK